MLRSPAPGATVVGSAPVVAVLASVVAVLPSVVAVLPSVVAVLAVLRATGPGTAAVLQRGRQHLTRQLTDLDASVGAFTRLWLGVRPASGLALTDELVGPPELVAALDAAFCLPSPLPDWPY